MDSDALRAKLLRFLQEQLGADAEALESNTELVSSGLVDSASLVQLATFVERQTDLEIERVRAAPQRKAQPPFSVETQASDLARLEQRLMELLHSHRRIREGQR